MTTIKSQLWPLSGFFLTLSLAASPCLGVQPTKTATVEIAGTFPADRPVYVPPFMVNENTDWAGKSLRIVFPVAVDFRNNYSCNPDDGNHNCAQGFVDGGGIGFQLSYIYVYVGGPGVGYISFTGRDESGTYVPQLIYNFALPEGAVYYQQDPKTGVITKGLRGGRFEFPLLPGFPFDDPRYGLVNATLRISNAIPEPATWVMWLAGFGLVGTLLRLRRSTDVPAAAL